MKYNQNLRAKDILKTEGIIYFSPENTLAEAVAKFGSSHDAEIVVNENQILQGIITPYYVSVKHVFPVQTKLKKCLYHPPKIYLQTPVEEVARLMVESKVHYLPVVDEKNKVLGLVTARRLLGLILNQPKMSNLPVSALLAGKNYLQTINLNSNVEEALRFFERTKLSKLVVVDKQGYLRGVLSMFDLLPLTAQTKERIGSFRRGAKPAATKHKYTVNNFLKTFTLTLAENQNVGKALKMILDQSIGSVLVIKDRRPLNILTTTDFLKYFFLL